MPLACGVGLNSQVVRACHTGRTRLGPILAASLAALAPDAPPAVNPYIGTVVCVLEPAVLTDEVTQINLVSDQTNVNKQSPFV